MSHINVIKLSLQDFSMTSIAAIEQGDPQFYISVKVLSNIWNNHWVHSLSFQKSSTMMPFGLQGHGKNFMFHCVRSLIFKIVICLTWFILHTFSLKFITISCLTRENARRDVIKPLFDRQSELDRPHAKITWSSLESREAIGKESASHPHSSIKGECRKWAVFGCSARKEILLQQLLSDGWVCEDPWLLTTSYYFCVTICHHQIYCASNVIHEPILHLMKF